ncbi:hypothetical protein [Pseudonocardia phyllosphaerae]|uniref:hypothetical protein n=1 Tax=Pseudonocardia phyllosphaerae TaxID=3390502 RepID=UPI0039792E93
MNDITTGAPTHRLPSLVRTRSGYRVFDPSLVSGTSYVVDDAGDLVYTRLPAGAMTVTGIAGSAVVAVVLGGDSWMRTATIFLAGLPAFFVLAVALLSVIHLMTDPVRAYQRRTGHRTFAVDVTDRDSVSWALCRRAERLAATRSWQSGRVDPQRTLGVLLWNAVSGGDGSGDGGGAVEALTSLDEPATGPGLTAV